MRADQATERTLRLLASAIALALLSFDGVPVDAEAAKPHPARKTFDFTPPHPGEMLANPAKGTGSPPLLREFAPSAALHLTQTEAGASAATADGAQAGDVGSKPRPASAGPVVQLSNAQRQLGDLIARSGIDGFLSQVPQASSPQEQRYLEAARQQISSSLSNWQTLYPAPGSAMRQGPPGSTVPPAAGDETRR